MSKRGRHKSLCKDGDRSVRWVEGMECVQKVILGRSESCRHAYAPGTIRVTQEVDAGFKIKIYGGSGITDGFVYLMGEHRPFFKTEVSTKFGDH